MSLVRPRCLPDHHRLEKMSVFKIGKLTYSTVLSIYYFPKDAHRHVPNWICCHKVPYRHKVRTLSLLTVLRSSVLAHREYISKLKGTAFIPSVPRSVFFFPFPSYSLCLPVCVHLLCAPLTDIIFSNYQKICLPLCMHVMCKHLRKEV